MNSFRNMATAVRQRVFRRSVRQQTQTLDPVVRTALAEDLHHDDHDLQRELQQIECELEQARLALAEAEKKETFLGQRSRQYRVALDEQARRLKDERLELERQQREMTGDNDEEENLWHQRELDLERRMQAWERDEDALSTVTQTHLSIMADCERMRRKIKELEHKQENCQAMAHEVGDFLHQATVAGQEEEETEEQEQLQQQQPSETELRTLVEHRSINEDNGQEAEETAGEDEKQSIVIQVV